MFKKISRLFHTLKYLKWSQILYQLIYRIRPNPSPPRKLITKRVNELSFRGLNSNSSYEEHNRFKFSNRTKTFDQQIDWCTSDFGKLWQYNLHYFEYINAQNFSKVEGLRLIYDFLDNTKTNHAAYEPYPTSLRIMNWIKFISKHSIRSNRLNKSLLGHQILLRKNLEYHLLGNHLLENFFALIWVSAYLGRSDDLAKYILKCQKQLTEQILQDGGHFEQSPMYHQIILGRLLETIELLDTLDFAVDERIKLRESARRMLGWLDEMTYTNGEVPMFNDSAPGIAPSSIELFDYGKKLNLIPEKMVLSESGYRRFYSKNWDCLIDIGNITASYIPGHTHSDIFNFEIRVNNLPVVVDAGISTYEKNSRRQFERSTAAHNTVTIQDKNQSDVWGGFRVGERAHVRLIEETENKIVAEHNGYRRLGFTHQRKFSRKQGELQIEDVINGKHSGVTMAKAHFHLAAGIEPIIKGNFVRLLPGLAIEFGHGAEIEICGYMVANGFNNCMAAKKIVTSFTAYLETRLIIDNQ